MQAFRGEEGFVWTVPLPRPPPVQLNHFGLHTGIQMSGETLIPPRAFFRVQLIGVDRCDGPSRTLRDHLEHRLRGPIAAHMKALGLEQFREPGIDVLPVIKNFEQWTVDSEVIIAQASVNEWSAR